MANLWTPLYLPYGTLTNWYDSTDTTTLTLSTNDTVVDWRDKSYKANNLSEADFAQLPTYGTTNINGLSTVNFALSSSINLDLAGQAPLNDNYYIIYTGFNNTFASTSTKFNLVGNNGVDSILIRSNSATTTQILFKINNVNVLNMSITGVSNENKTVIYSLDVVNDVATANLNFTNTVSGTASLTVNSLTGLTLGATVGDGVGLNGQIGEFIIVQQDAITLADKQKLEGYTAWKWGQQGLLPTDHPYAALSGAPTVTDVEFRNKLYETSTEEGSSRFRRLFALGYV